MTIKICFISHSSGLMGAEKSLLETIKVLKEEGIKCFVLVPNQGPLVKELEKLKVSYKIFFYRGWVHFFVSPIWKRIARVFLNFVLIFPIAMIIKRWHCDVIYTNTITVCVGALASKIIGKAHIWHIHEILYKHQGIKFDLGSIFSIWLIKKLSTMIITNSKFVEKKYKPLLPNKKIKAVYQPVNICNYIPLEFYELKKMIEQESSFKCVIVGSLHIGKHQDEAIQAISVLVKKGLNIKLYIVGSGRPEYQLYLENLITKNNLKENVILLGYIDKPFFIIEQSDVFLMCSRDEAFGRVTIEAMKLGKPVIGSRSGATIELIREGFNGLFYNPGDFEELSQKITILYENRIFLKQLGENAQKWATELFKEDNYKKDMVSIIKEVIKF